MKKNQSTFDGPFRNALGGVVFFLVVLLTFPYVFTQCSAFDWGFTAESGAIGDTIGGTIGPFVAMAGAILTFYAFWVQYKANQQQRNDLELERFESKFYALIEIHRQNVSDTSVGKSAKGRKVFVEMYKELKYTYFAVEACYQHRYYKDSNPPISEEVRFHTAYMIFLFGIGQHSSPLVKDRLGEEYEDFFFKVEEYLNELRLPWEPKKSISINDATNPNKPYKLYISYKPFGGHLSSLSHYERHLFQLVEYVHQAPEHLLSYEEKYAFMTTVRAQLSIHEQLMLYYHALTPFGQRWIDSPNFLTEYTLLQNIPLPLADFYRRPGDFFFDEMTNSHGKPLFAWTDFKPGPASPSKSSS